MGLAHLGRAVVAVTPPFSMKTLAIRGLRRMGDTGLEGGPGGSEVI